MNCAYIFILKYTSIHTKWQLLIRNTNTLKVFEMSIDFMACLGWIIEIKIIL